MIYTHYSKFRNKVYLRYISDDNQRCSKMVDFSPTYYINSSTPNTDIKTIYGETLKKCTSKNVGSDWWRDIKQYDDIENMDVYGISNATLQFINHEFGNVDLLSKINPDLIRRLNIDIETETEVDTGFPNIEEANEVITLISALDSTMNKTICFHLDNVDEEFFNKENVVFVMCEDEEDLLMKFVKFWSTDYPDIVSGWNISQFDIPYTINRIRRVLGQEWVSRLSPIGVVGQRTQNVVGYGRDQHITTIQGIEIIDTMALYKNIEKSPRESYSLEFISMFELKVGKLRHPSGVAGHKLYKTPDLRKIKTTNDWGEWEDIRLLILEELEEHSPIRLAKIKQHFYNVYVLYNVIDVRRAFEVEESKGLFDITYFLAYYSFSNFEDTLSSMRTWTNLLSVYCLNDHKSVFSLKNKKSSKDGKYIGAFVREPIVGRYSGAGCITSYDLASLYPNILRALNMSPETILNNRYDIDLDKLLEHKTIGMNDNEAVAGNGVAFDRENLGILPKKIKELFDIRKSEKLKSFEMFKMGRAIEERIAELEG